MNVRQLLDALDAQILRGDILGAFDQFFADDCVTFASDNDMTRGKAEKMQSLRWFFDGMARTNRIERLGTQIDGDISLSEFIFDFTDRNGQNHTWHEVIRRRWQDGRVVEERYFTDLANDNPLQPGAQPGAEPAAKPATRKKAAAAKAEPTEVPAAEPMTKGPRKKTAPAAGLSGTREAKTAAPRKKTAATAPATDNGATSEAAAPAKRKK